MEQLTAQLEHLHDHYAAQVNIAIAEGWDDLVEALAEEFTEARLDLLQKAIPPAHPVVPKQAGQWRVGR